MDSGQFCLWGFVVFGFLGFSWVFLEREVGWVVVGVFFETLTLSLAWQTLVECYCLKPQTSLPTCRLYR